jgi:hypothetical protein
MQQSPYTFSLTQRQIEMFSEWKKQFDQDDCGPIGGSFSFIFIPTSLFTAVYIKHISGAKFDLTDYDN